MYLPHCIIDEKKDDEAACLNCERIEQGYDLKLFTHLICITYRTKLYGNCRSGKKFLGFLEK